MTRPLKFIGSAIRAGSATLLAFALWSLWLALGGLLVVQSYILFTSELAVHTALVDGVYDEVGQRQLGERYDLTHLSAPTARYRVPRFSPWRSTLTSEIRSAIAEFHCPSVMPVTLRM